MLKLTRYPVAFSLILGLFLLAAMSLLANLFTLWTTSILSGDAKAVNVSGSLRMQSFKIAYAIERQTPEAEVIPLLETFEERLSSSALKDQIPENHTELNNLFTSIELQFRQMREDALNDPDQYQTQVQRFVNDIDTMVVLLETWSENKVNKLRQQQIFITLITLFSALLFALVIYKRVIMPLQTLNRAVLTIGQGDHLSRANYQGEDEFGDLAKTLNFMANEVADIHQSLETKIAEQTLALSRNNQVLEFLFNLSKQLSTEKPDIKMLKVQTLSDLQKICQDKNIEWHDKFHTHQVNDYFIVCVEADQSCLVCTDKHALEDWQKRIVMTVSDLFDNAMNRMGANEQRNRIDLLNERSSIARELHDSLAQQLSYLKIQVVRLVKLRERDADEEALNTIIAELREGLNTSYRKLRELLVTFRSHLDEPGLLPSVKTAADEINRISPNTQVHLYIDDHWPTELTPNQEIHCLHVIREALTNVIKHAQAKNVEIALKVLPDERLEIKINDDGIGFNDRLDKPMHYGLDIMSERAARIGGNISYQNLDHTGAGITLIFPRKTEQETTL